MAHQPTVSHRSALISAHIVAILFGMTALLGAFIRVDAWAITAGRAAFAVLTLLVLAFWLKCPFLRGLDARKAMMLFSSGLMLAAHWITFFLAVKTGGVAMATLGFASFPAFIALIDWLVFRERIGRAEITLLVMISAGLVLVTPAFDAADRNTVGLLWGVLSGFTFALLAVINRRASRGMDAIQVSLWQNLIVLLAVAPFVSGSSIAQATPGDWLGIGLLGILCTGVAHYLFVRSLEGLDARSVGMIVSLEPVYAIAAAWWLFDEQPSLRMLVGAILIILASVQVSRRRNAGH